MSIFRLLTCFGLAHRGIGIDHPDWHRSGNVYDTDAVSGFAKTTPVFSTDGANLSSELKRIAPTDARNKAFCPVL